MERVEGPQSDVWVDKFTHGKKASKKSLSGCCFLVWRFFYLVLGSFPERSRV